ncbi:MAG: hypothetical protein HYY65_02930, partial [Candidatus Tectomicrobia bacterium]|nr:hypothetical protein [Candidatus Tectomicrobia bacterium]
MANKAKPRKSPTAPIPEGIRFLIAHENQNIRKFLLGCLQGMGCLNAVEWVPGRAILGTLLDEGAHVLIVNGETPE